MKEVLLADPTDPLSQQAYADWLEEQGQVEQAQLHRYFALVALNKLTPIALLQSRSLSREECLELASAAGMREWVEWAYEHTGNRGGWGRPFKGRTLSGHAFRVTPNLPEDLSATYGFRFLGVRKSSAWYFSAEEDISYFFPGRAVARGKLPVGRYLNCYVQSCTEDGRCVLRFLNGPIG